MQISFERGQEIARESLTLPAEYYRKIHLLFARAPQDSLFVPIRSMQYLAVIDSNEVVFVDGQGPRVIEVAWCGFHHQDPDDLLSSVDYTCIYYLEKGRLAMQRLQAEFLEALSLLEARQPRPAGGSVTPLKGREK